MAVLRDLTMSHDLEGIAATLVGDEKGVLAADETVATFTKRFDTLRIPSTEQSLRTYREMLFTAAGEAEFISGVILQDETIHQKSSDGTPLIQVLSRQGIQPGIKVDTGATGAGALCGGRTGSGSDRRAGSAMDGSHSICRSSPKIWG
jgi:fructose-bisphosphate aldolase class I